MSRTAYYYKPKLSDDSEIIDVLNELTDKIVGASLSVLSVYASLAIHGIISEYTVFIPR